MRVVGGKFRHRTIKMTNLETTRETQDKVRESIFNMIGPYFDGGVCLDLFAGSGALAIEAYSRGMEEIHLNDVNPKAIEVCKENCKTLGILNSVFSCLDYLEYLKSCNKKFDLIFLDPPYKMNQIVGILDQIFPWVKPNGKIIFEMAKDSKYPNNHKGLFAIKDKIYGIKRVVIYKKEGEENICE